MNCLLDCFCIAIAKKISDLTRASPPHRSRQGQLWPLEPVGSVAHHPAAPRVQRIESTWSCQGPKSARNDPRLNGRDPGRRRFCSGRPADRASWFWAHVRARHRTAIDSRRPRGGRLADIGLSRSARGSLFKVASTGPWPTIASWSFWTRTSAGALVPFSHPSGVLARIQLRRVGVHVGPESDAA